ncbi:MAG: DinB family protein [Gemmataceae bacterium]
MLNRQAKPELALLLQIIDEAFDKKAWHGPNLRGCIRRLEVEEAVWRPAPGRHNIWEIVVHTAYWKYIVRRRLLGEKRGSFVLKGSNWFDRPVTKSAQAWRAEVQLLEETHRQMRAAIAAMNPADLHETPPGSKVSNAALISGIAAHDIYHAGQIQVLKRLARGGLADGSE